LKLKKIVLAPGSHDKISDAQKRESPKSSIKSGIGMKVMLLSPQLK